MTGVRDPESGRTFNDTELAWIGAHLTDLRRSVAERRIRNWMLWSGLGIGLVAHVAGFLLKASVTGEPIGDSKKNLKSAVVGETYEYTQMYPGFAKTAREEGHVEIAEWFETLAKAEKSHAGRFQKGLDTLL